MGKVYINGREAVHKGCGGKAIAFPDVCLCPPGPPAGPIPTPLTNTAEAKDMKGGAITVTIEGNPIGTIDSYISTSTGNEIARSTGGGIMSHTVQGKAHFHTGSPDVLIEGKRAIRQGDLLTQNHLAEIPGNTPPSVWMATVSPGGPPSSPPKHIEKNLQEGKDWIELLLVDVLGQPAVTSLCHLQTPGGKEIEARVLGGGTLAVRGIAKGNCTITFPVIDSHKHEAETHPEDKIPKPPSNPGKQSGADKAYRSGSPLSLATGHAYKIELPLRPSYWLTVPKARKKTKNEQVTRYTLVSTDDTYQVTRALNDHVRRVRDASTLEFPDADPDLTYSLFSIVGKGEKYPVFVSRKWSEIVPGSIQASEPEEADNDDGIDIRDSIRVAHTASLRGKSSWLDDDEDAIDPEGDDGEAE